MISPVITLHLTKLSPVLLSLTKSLLGFILHQV